MNIWVVLYLLIGIYVGQSVTILGWHYTKWDRVLDYFLAVFWLPAGFVAILLYLLEKLSSKRNT